MIFHPWISLSNFRIPPTDVDAAWNIYCKKLSCKEYKRDQSVCSGIGYGEKTECTKIVHIGYMYMAYS